MSFDKQACIMLVTGFNGALRYWWDNLPDRITQNSIINHVEKKRRRQRWF